MNDLLLRTRRAGPAALFRNELTRMTLREWSEALLIATRRTEERSELEIPEWVRGEVQQELMRGRKTMLVILGESATSPTAQWLPSKQHGCLWIEAARWFEYYDTLRLGEPNSLTDAIRWYVAVEVSGDPDTLAQLVRRDVLSVFGSPPAVPVAPELTVRVPGQREAASAGHANRALPGERQRRRRDNRQARHPHAVKQASLLASGSFRPA